MNDQIQPKFECWAILELFGHTMLAGKVSEQVVSGVAFIRVDVPETPNIPKFTKFQNPSSIYGMTPVDEEYAKKMAEKLEVQPVSDYKHTQIIRELVEKKMASLQEPTTIASQPSMYDEDNVTDPDFEDTFDYEADFNEGF